MLKNYWNKLDSKYDELNIHLKVLAVFVACLLGVGFAILVALSIGAVLFALSSLIGGTATAILAMVGVLYAALYGILLA